MLKRPVCSLQHRVGVGLLKLPIGCWRPKKVKVGCVSAALFSVLECDSTVFRLSETIQIEMEA